MITPVWERLARQVDLTLKTSSIGIQKVEKIYILSSVNFDKSILDYMSDQLDAKTELFDPFKHIRISRPLNESLSFPREYCCLRLWVFPCRTTDVRQMLFLLIRKRIEKSKTKRIEQICFFVLSGGFNYLSCYINLSRFED